MQLLAATQNQHVAEAAYTAPCAEPVGVRQQGRACSLSRWQLKPARSRKKGKKTVSRNLKHREQLQGIPNPGTACILYLHPSGGRC
ncbi:hypothetical protein NDU88_010735 [Pleurodeles waltl]|uniref:Uncharacterized protein n=1 Tax=Pleurodeles waltl TaxID=8319 RepID=A0AAV7RZ27_PLEWA|nr:hypothetical protein NDU88_010735 [Pleurodeles waltl]